MPKSNHDQFVSRSLEHVAIARDFFKQYVPSDLKGDIVRGNLSRIDRSSTDLVLKKLHRDMLYRTQLVGGRDLICAVEHQSTDDPMMQVRYMRYDANVLEAYIKNKCDQLPLIINLLLYHSPTTPSSYLKESVGYYKHHQNGKEHLYLFFYLINLMQMSDAEILTHGLCAPLEILLKHSFDGIFELPISSYQDIFHACIHEVGDDYIVSMLAYCDSIKNLAIGKNMHKFVESIFKNKQDKSETIMTYGQFLKKEGRQEEKLDIVKNMLLKDCDISFIQEITGVSKKNITNLKKEIEKTTNDKKVA